MAQLLRRLAYLIRQRRLERELAEEIETHRAMSGDPRRFGNLLQAREDARAVWVMPSWDSLCQDLAHGARSVWRQRGLTAAVVLTLTLGVGANAILFSAVRAVLLEPLPYRDPDRLVWLTEYLEQFKVETTFLDVFLEWRRSARSFAAMAVFNVGDGSLSSGGAVREIRAVSVSSPIGPLLGITPALGRDFVGSELDLRSGPGLDRAILSDPLFRTQFGGDAGVIGRTVSFQGRPVIVIGVLPAAFRMPLRPGLRPGPQLEPDVLLNFPLSASSGAATGGGYPVQVLARLRPGAPAESARAELATIAEAFRAATPASSRAADLRVLPLRERIVGSARPGLLVLAGVVAFVLLVACVNVVNLLLARAPGRRAEMAVRTALGAGRPRLIRQLVTESTLLALAGGAGGVLLAVAGIELVAAISPPEIPRLRDMRLDWSVLGFAAAVCMLTAVGIGTAPAFLMSQADPATALYDGGRTRGPSRRQSRLQSALVVAEVAMALILLAGAGLMLRSLWAVHAAAGAYDPQRVLTFRVTSRETRPDAPPDGHVRLIDELAARLSALPGVTAAASWVETVNRLLLPADQVPGAGSPVQILESIVTGDFMAASSVRLLAGRWYDPRDETLAAGPVVINETAARLLVPPGDDPRRVVGRPLLRRTIVGVVSDFQWLPEADAVPQMLSLYAHAPNRAAARFLVRTSSAAGLDGAIRQAVTLTGLDVTAVETLGDRAASVFAPRRFQTALFLAFAALSLVLALVGIYGVLSYRVSQRVQEIGVRMALGASAGGIMRSVLRQGMTLVAAGTAAGLLGALALTTVMRGLLYGVAATDPATYAAVCGMLGAVAVGAAFFPARRAMRLNPTAALRSEP